jgi:hypothetical protein
VAHVGTDEFGLHAEIAKFGGNGIAFFVAPA